MKKAKIIGISAVALSSAVLLAACGNNSSSTSKSSDGPTKYTYVYSTDPTTMDYLATNQAVNSTIYSNFEDGLMENDPDGNYVGALAKSWSVSADGKTYTYKLRSGVNWVQADGSTYAPVKASDFVTGMKHAVSAKSTMLYLVQPLIEGLDDYVNGKTKDFSKVGIVADDKAGTVSYHLTQPASYWNSLTTYSILFPVNADFLASKGENFGNVSSPDNILYSGPYTLSNFTSKSVIEMKANPSYWDKKNVHVKSVKLNYNDGSQPSALFTQFDKGVYTQATVYPNDSSYKQVLKNYKDDVTYGLTGATTYNITFNLNRESYKLTKKTDSAEKESTKKAILNRDFRAAISYALNREDYLAQVSGKTGAVNKVRNSLVPTTFVNIDGKPYGDTVKSTLDSLDSSVWKDTNINTGNNSAFNPTVAKAEFAKAKTALEKEGVKFPIHLDLPQDQSGTLLINQAKSLKESVESTLGKENVVIDLNLADQDAYYAATYMATSGAQSDFDISSASGWGPDYIDPSTYLNIYDSRHGDMLQTLGLIGTDSQPSSASQTVAIKAVGLEKYDSLLDEAAKYTDTKDLDKRYTAYAKAEAELLNSFIQIPVQADGGLPGLSKTVPFTGAYGQAGVMNRSSGRFKFVKLQDDVVSQTQYDKALKTFKKANEKATTLDETKD
ncbi:peptide ABC transporter substrate-binding protein [Lactococcus fujiensis]|uniref:Peptide-binding protein n=1 Tax=Lactococcus fujiensis JCM 16395 TaxID=1291764 RepID=A0A2A5RNJ2_9LACT|nr:peptide ABC transporter substrate-binding protein [Lactococcus fujiensis]PCS00929.1 peptide-binding protein [Lactococcus fujiensis JCM 16395]